MSLSRLPAATVRPARAQHHFGGLGTPLLFLLGLALPNRFRMK
jgi:hypothetical protein